MARRNDLSHLILKTFLSTSKSVNKLLIYKKLKKNIARTVLLVSYFSKIIFSLIPVTSFCAYRRFLILSGHCA